MGTKEGGADLDADADQWMGRRRTRCSRRRGAVAGAIVVEACRRAIAGMVRPLDDCINTTYYYFLGGAGWD